jgi:hypothetical protein
MIINISGYDVLIDDEDFDKIKPLKWYRSYSGKRKLVYFISVGTRPNRKTIRLHRFIINAPNGKEVDHINSDTLDNRKINLRICTRDQNACNRRKNLNNTSGYKGVYFENGRWRAMIGTNGKLKSLGKFGSKEEAHKAYCEASKRYHGEFGNIL